MTTLETDEQPALGTGIALTAGNGMTAALVGSIDAAAW